MSFELQSDRDILIETATTVKEMRRAMERRDQDQDRINQVTDDRVRRLEQLRWMIWGAVILATGSGFEMVRAFLGGK